MAKKKYIHPTRIFKKPEELLKAWEEYKADVDSSAKKWAKIQYVGKDGQRVQDNPPMPYDMDGFYSWYHDKYNRHIHHYFDNNNKYYDEFGGIVTRIVAERNANIKTGTLLGFFNASMGNRIAGLAEKNENINNTSVKLLSIDPLDDSNDNSTPKDSSTQKED